jgi:hypothetical protein
MPRGNPPTRLLAEPGRPAASSAPSAAAESRSGATYDRARSTTSNSVSQPSNSETSGHTATRRRGTATSTMPRSACRMPAMIDNIVVFPTPLGPTSPYTHPRGTRRSTSNRPVPCRGRTPGPPAAARCSRPACRAPPAGRRRGTRSRRRDQGPASSCALRSANITGRLPLRTLNGSNCAPQRRGAVGDPRTDVARGRWSAGLVTLGPADARAWRLTVEAKQANDGSDDHEGRSGL